MAIDLTYQGVVQSDGNTAQEYTSDTVRIWSMSQYYIQGSVQSGSNNAAEYLGDSRRVWSPGGVMYGGSVIVNSNSKSESVSDTRRIWQAGGIAVFGIAFSGSNSSTEYLGDTFRIRDVTLQKKLQSFPMLRRVVQPSGIPWLNDEVTTAAWCWKLTLKDGTVFGFTNHDEDIVSNNVTYEAATGFVPTAVETSNNMSVDNLEVEGFLDSASINENDIAIGRFDFAKVEIFVCNWMKLKDPLFITRKGTIGQVKHSKYGFQAEVRGLLEAYQQSAGIVYQKTCRAKLGDAKCTVNVNSLSVAGTVTQVNADGTFNTSLTQGQGYFDYGIMSFTAGTNMGGQYEVKTFAGGIVTLFLPTLYPVAVGDTFTVLPGCDGNFSTCKTKFNNVLHFRGEPHIPGNDYQSSYPSQGSSNTNPEPAAEPAPEPAPDPVSYGE